MKSSVSPMFLTYYMVKWDEIQQEESNQKCTECGLPLKRTEKVTDGKGLSYEGYVCHRDRSVTWVKIG